ncbi:hypothetical protein WMY93_032485, partial [Mugilogobius chulae]
MSLLFSLQPRAVNVDLQTDATLQVDISDALSERDKVKFTVHTKSTLPNFKQNEFSVVRQHEEFIWLHDSFVENEEYAGYIIPPAPPRPDFDASREKLQKLGEGEGSMTKEEFTKMKQELEAEYLAIFKKTVAMHEVFLCRVAAHPVLRKDLNFHVFLEYGQDLSVRGKNKKEKLEDFFKNVVKSADGVLVAGVKDVDDFFEHEKTFLLEYHTRVKDASAKSDRMIRSHKNAADDINRIASTLYTLGTQDGTELCKKSAILDQTPFVHIWKLNATICISEGIQKWPNSAPLILFSKIRTRQTRPLENQITLGQWEPDAEKSRSKNMKPGPKNSSCPNMKKIILWPRPKYLFHRRLMKFGTNIVHVKT